eukprot:TRINITY_DN826_c1_g1_i1.p1 TRINITY_DN826_c1_g1~~TRINITY_DN826_c1_g1_i1.p1  ORF type:complete len:562 (+),score=111.51 TRINITY_DN826_c1_g1_i1:65-1750(+)
MERALLFSAVLVLSVAGQELIQYSISDTASTQRIVDMVVLNDVVFRIPEAHPSQAVFVTNVADNGNPVELGSFGYSGSGFPTAVMTDGTRLFVLFQKVLVAYDVSVDPASPVVLHTYAPTNGAEQSYWRGLTQSDNHIFVTHYERFTSSQIEHLFVLDKDTLNQVGEVPIWTASTVTYDITYHGGKVYAACDHNVESLLVFDVSDPTNPILESAFQIPPIHSVLRIRFFEGFVYISDQTGSSFRVPLKIDPVTGASVPITLPTSEVHSCSDMLFHNSRVYLACRDTGLFVLQETSPNTFTLLAKDTRGAQAAFIKDGYLYVGNGVDPGSVPDLMIYKIPDIVVTPPVPVGLVVLVGGSSPIVEKPVGGEGSSVEDVGSGQRWEQMPSWLGGSTAFMGADGKKGMVLKMTCPSNSNNLPCTFYVTLHNCLPCSSALNGGLPHGLLAAGFDAGSCGPKYVPTFPRAPSKMSPLPSVTFRMEVASGGAPVEVPVTRELLHFSVFVQHKGNGCSLHQDEAGCSGASGCFYDLAKGCVDRPLCKRSPANPGNAGGAGPKCTCFSPP